MKDRILFIGSLLALPFFIWAKEPLNFKQEIATEYYDLTQVDITRMEDVDANEMSIMGIHLGNTIPEVKSIVNSQDNLLLLQDKFNNDRFYLYHKEKEQEEKTLLAYLKWPNPDARLTELVMYPGLAMLLEGANKKLVSEETMEFDKRRGIARTYLGYPIKKKIILDVESVGLKHIAYFYKDKNYQVIQQIKDDQVKHTFGIFSHHLKFSKMGQGAAP